MDEPSAVGTAQVPQKPWRHEYGVAGPRLEEDVEGGPVARDVQHLP